MTEEKGEEWRGVEKSRKRRQERTQEGGVERRGQDEIGEEWKREHISIPVLMCLKVPVQ